jgi:UDP-glucose 4-epimerase
MKILVTGGVGYIGSQTTLALQEAGHEVVIFDRRIGSPRAILAKGTTAVTGDLLDPSALQALFGAHQFDAVVHFAALIQAGESVAKPLEFYENNTMGTLNLLQAMQTANVSRIVFSSTAAVYGDADQIPTTETAHTLPTNPYGQSKLMVEKILEDCFTGYDLESVRLRYFNAAGADLEGRTGENHDSVTHLIPIVIEVAQQKRPKLLVNGNDYATKDGTAVRDYIHTADLAAAHVTALERLLKSPGKKVCEVYNLGTGEGQSVLEIVKMVEEVSGQKVPVEFGPRRAGDPETVIASCAKANQELGWRAQHSDLKTIITTAWQWAQSHSW